MFTSPKVLLSLLTMMVGFIEYSILGWFALSFWTWNSLLILAPGFYYFLSWQWYISYYVDEFSFICDWNIPFFLLNFSIYYEDFPPFISSIRCFICLLDPYSMSLLSLGRFSPVICLKVWYMPLTTSCTIII